MLIESMTRDPGVAYFPGAEVGCCARGEIYHFLCV